MEEKEQLTQYHCIYRITNKVNSKTYIGVHSTFDIDDKYMGSGTALRHSIKKYGAKEFIREILFVFNTREQALLKEKELVNKDFVLNPMTYNLVCGGGGISKVRKEKKDYAIFNKDASETRFCPYDEEYEYHFKIKNHIEYYRYEGPSSNGYNIISKFLEDEQHNMLAYISKLYNNTHTHKEGHRILHKLYTYPQFAGNISLQKTKWQNQISR